MYDDSRLDDPRVLERFDERLRYLAETGARVRREAGQTQSVVTEAVERLKETRPRAVIAAGPDSRLLRAVLEPHCPVPLVAWPNPRLPGWAGGLDLVVVLAPQGSDSAAASGVAEAVRRGCQVVVAAPEHSLVAQHAEGKDTTLLPTVTGDGLATAVVVLELLHRLGLAPQVDSEEVAAALDDVAVSCSPFRDLALNPAKNLASAIAETTPLLWGGTVLAARAARRVAESIRTTTGRPALATVSEQLLPLLESTAPQDVFADPFADPVAEARPSLVVFDDGVDDADVRRERGEIVAAAQRARVRTEVIASHAKGEVSTYSALMATGLYAATYLAVGEAS